MTDERPTLWVCGACGKTGDARDTIGDEACYMWGNLCYLDSLVYDQLGNLRGAQAVPGAGR